MFNPYLIGSVIKDISKKSLNCRLLSNTFKEEVDNRKFVYEKNKHEMFDEEDTIGIFHVDSPYKSYLKLNKYNGSSEYSTHKSYYRNNKTETKIILKYYLSLFKDDDPAKCLLSKTNLLTFYNLNHKVDLKSNRDNKNYFKIKKVDHYYDSIRVMYFIIESIFVKRMENLEVFNFISISVKRDMLKYFHMTGLQGFSDFESFDTESYDINQTNGFENRIKNKKNIKLYT